MEAYTNELVSWILTLSPFSIYAIFTFLSYLENVVPPIPGDVLIVFGGYLAAEEVLGFISLLTVVTIASVVGFMNMYAIGFYFGDKIERHREEFWLMRFVDVDYFDRAKRWMSRWGQGVILANRFLAGTRSVISITAGLTKTKIYRTILSSSISSLFWNFVLLGTGWLVHENWQAIGHYLNVYGWFVLIITAVSVGGKLLYNRYFKADVEKEKKN